MDTDNDAYQLAIAAQRHEYGNSLVLEGISELAGDEELDAMLAASEEGDFCRFGELACGLITRYRRQLATNSCMRNEMRRRVLNNYDDPRS